MPALSSVAAISTPVITAQAIFSARRAKKGIETMENNPVEGILNENIAGAQMIKCLMAAKAISAVSNPIYEEGATESIKRLAANNKVVNGACKVLKFTANNVNTVIGVTSLAKVLGSDDKCNTAISETCALATMFGFEGLSKRLLGMPKTEIKDWKQVDTPREALYKRSEFLDKNVNKFVKYCENNKLFNKIPLKSLPASLKGLGFVSASIIGYKLGDNFAKKYLISEKTQNCNLQEQNDNVQV